MSTAIEHAIERQSASYEQSLRAVAARHHVDLVELRHMTKYVGRNIERATVGIGSELESIRQLETQAARDRRGISLNLGNLIAVTSSGFMMTLQGLNQISGQLEQIVGILANWDDARAAARREKGLYLAGKGKIQLAVAHLKQAIALNVTDFVALHALGFLYASNEQLDVAATAFADSSLYADRNPALSVEAAILSARCYAQLGDEQKAWQVLSRAIYRNCPDLALPLMKYATDTNEFDRAQVEMTKAFLIDAELAVVAEQMELPHIQVAAGQANRVIKGHVKSLIDAWDELHTASTEAGLKVNHAKPRAPKQTENEQTNLLNNAMYRRRIQLGLTNMRDEIGHRLAVPEPVGEAPVKPEFQPGLWLRLPLILVFVITAAFALHDFAWVQLGLAAIIAAALMNHDIPRWEIYVAELRSFWRAKKEAKNQTKLSHRLNGQFEQYRPIVESAFEQANKALAATVPPPVVRAFASDLVSYTGFRPQQF